jgi:predicted lipid-binding transport protein (Tim44 family)
MRTYSAPRSYGTPSVAPVQRSMTPQTASPYAQPGYQPSPYANPPRQPYRPGFGGGLATGLITGGLIGAMMGHGWGGGWGGGYGGYGAGGGMLAVLFQLLVLGGIAWFVLRLFRRRQADFDDYQPAFQPQPPSGIGGYAPAAPQPGAGPWGAPPSGGQDIGVSAADRADFERLLGEVQGAYSREDFAGLRERCTPEIVSFLSEELGQNATQGRRNDVTGLRLLQMDVTEAWREADADYATAQLRYESTDVMRDRQSGQVVKGDPERPTQTTELWTFVRRAGSPWKLSAIQETGA